MKLANGFYDVDCNAALSGLGVTNGHPGCRLPLSADPSANTVNRLALGRRPHSGGGLRSQPSKPITTALTLTGMTAYTAKCVANRSQLIHSCPIRGDYSRCMAMYRSGRRIAGTKTTLLIPRRMAPHGSPPTANSASGAAVRSEARHRCCGRQRDFRRHKQTASPSSVFESSGRSPTDCFGTQ